MTQAIKLNFKYRGIDPEVFKKTAESIYRLRGGIRDYTIEKWAAGFPTLSQGGVNAYTYTRVLLSEPIRNFIGPIGNIPQGINTDKTSASAHLLTHTSGCKVSHETTVNQGTCFLNQGTCPPDFSLSP